MLSPWWTLAWSWHTERSAHSEIREDFICEQWYKQYFMRTHRERQVLFVNLAWQDFNKWGHWDVRGFIYHAPYLYSCQLYSLKQYICYSTFHHFSQDRYCIMSNKNNWGGRGSEIMERLAEKFEAEGMRVVYALKNLSPFCSSMWEEGGPGCLAVWS